MCSRPTANWQSLLLWVWMLTVCKYVFVFDQCVQKQATAAFSSQVCTAWDYLLWILANHLPLHPMMSINSVLRLWVAVVVGCHSIRVGIAHLTPAFLYMCLCVYPVLIPSLPLVRFPGPGHAGQGISYWQNFGNLTVLGVFFRLVSLEILLPSSEGHGQITMIISKPEAKRVNHTAPPCL